jgi:hypothetical protein
MKKMERGETNVTRGFKVSGMPMSQWIDWERGAIEDYGNCYWLKLWSDHEKAQQFDIIFNQIFRKLEEHDAVLESLIPSEEKEEKVKTFGE